MNASPVSITFKAQPTAEQLALDKRTLRKQLRTKRRSLSKRQQRFAAQKLLQKLKISSYFLSSQHIALYLGNDGEICPEQLIQHIFRWRKKAYLPVIHPLHENSMVFCQVTPKTKLNKNRYGILEPDFKHSQKISAKHLSLVLMPLVGFDTQGNRMGMGGGYYDRIFSYKHKKPRSKPKLLGLAHECQKLARLPVNEWDVSLDAVVTDQHIYRNF